MSGDDGLDDLTSKQLHDMAVSRAKRHLDVRFFFRLMELLPTAEAAAGKMDEAETDVLKLTAHVDDVTRSGEGEVGDLLRPFYMEYLRKHHVTAS